MRLIDANEFRRYAHEQLELDKSYTADEILKMIDEQPTENASDNNWIKVEYHYVTDEEREQEKISDDISYMLDCRLPENEEEILIVRKWYDNYITDHDTCFIDNGYFLDSGTDWKDVVAWMPLPTYSE